MNILFLTVTDQHKHPMNAYVDVHCTYDFRNWIEGFCGVPHRFYFFDFYESFVKQGPLQTETEILRIACDHRIDLVIVPNLYYEINISFIETLHIAHNARILLVFFDDSGRFEDTNKYYVGNCDYILTHESITALEYYRAYDISASFFPCLPSVSFYGKLLTESSTVQLDPCDVSFVGAKIADRDQFISELIACNVQVEVFGGGWPNGRIAQDEMIRVFRHSKISLNFTKSMASHGGKQLKARAFEIVMAGGFLLTEYDEELVSYFEVGSEIDTFETPNECALKCKYYLENPHIREAMRARGLEKCLNGLNFETAWTGYLEELENSKSSSIRRSNLVICPTKAIRSFVRWNVGYVVGRLMTNQPMLALDQLKWAHREARHLSAIYPAKRILLVFSSEVLFSCLIIIRSHFRRYSLLQRIKLKLTFAKNCAAAIGLNQLLIRPLRYAKNQIHLFRLKRCIDRRIGDQAKVTIQNYDFKLTKQGVLRFVESMRMVSEVYLYRYSHSCSVPTLYASAYACMTKSMVGALAGINLKEKASWVGYFDSFQDIRDGLFYDSAVLNDIYADSDWWGARHLALHMIAAYTALDARPRYPFKFLEHYYSRDRLSKWINDIEWSSNSVGSLDPDNKIMNIGCLLQYQRDFWQDKEAGNALEELKSLLKSKINPNTGMWGDFEVDDPWQRSRMVQFAYHLFAIFFYDGDYDFDAERIVGITLLTQNKYGGFGVSINSSACEDIDSIDILIRFNPFVSSHLQAGIRSALKRAFNWVHANQLDDGGFVFRLNESFRYGSDQTRSSANQGAMLPTWFRSLSLLYLSEYFQLEADFRKTLCPGY